MAELHEPLARRATELLLAVAAGDESAANEYDALLFVFLRDTALRRGRFMSADAAERAGLQAASAGGVRSADVEEVAVVAAQLALRRARGSALRFDPGRGDGASCAIAHGPTGNPWASAASPSPSTGRQLQPVFFSWVERFV